MTLSRVLLPLLSFVLILLNANTLTFGQTAVQVGAGSYASSVPTSEPTYNASLIAAEVDVADTNTRAIPTNDWWTQLLFEDLAGNLWSYPQALDPENYGFEYVHATTHVAGGTWMDGPVEVKASGFNPTKDVVKNWSDWAVEFVLEDGNQRMDITMVHGVPFTWVQTDGINPEIHFPNGGSFYNDNGQAVTLPYTGDHIGFSHYGRDYGLHCPAGTQFSLDQGALVADYGGGEGYFVLSSLNSKSELGERHALAYNRPINTQVNWSYDPEQGEVQASWDITTENLTGASAGATLQGFIPHHYRDAEMDFTFSEVEYLLHHGLGKFAEGNSFGFTYAFNGVLDHLPSPEVSAVPNPYRPDITDELFSKYLDNNGQYGGDTYWGGKDLIRMAKYSLIGRQTNHASHQAMLDNAKTALIDWLTYEPGEDQHYFARMDQWGALIGFDPSYGSEHFTDNHFHLGYHTYALAMVMAQDPQFAQDYGDMAKLVAKQYANWDRTDGDFPVLRTFDPWAGHSYADGKSGNDGNNQESTSESMQGWAGVFLLGEVLGDDQMRAAGAFGYLSEARATQEYWFDWKNETFDALDYDKDIVGILFSAGRGFGTWFSGEPIHIYGIHWLPWAPIHNYQAWDLDHAEFLYNSLMEAEDYPADIAAAFGDDWANVVMAYQQQFDPAGVAKELDDYYNADAAVVKTYPTGGLTYYYTHSGRGLGHVQLDHHISIPNSATYLHPTTGVYSYVVHNTRTTIRDAVVYKDGVEVKRFTVPANTLMVAHPDAVGMEETALEIEWIRLGNQLKLAEKVKWQVVDGQGRVVSQGYSNEISLAELATGLYHVYSGVTHRSVVK